MDLLLVKAKHYFLIFLMQHMIIENIPRNLGTVAHACHPNTGEAETGIHSLRSA